jgi:hypothetical protein
MRGAPVLIVTHALGNHALIDSDRLRLSGLTVVQGCTLAGLLFRYANNFPGRSSAGVSTHGCRLG